MENVRYIVAQVVMILVAPAVVFARGRGGHVGRSELFEAQSRALDNMELGLKVMIGIAFFIAVGLFVHLGHDIFKIIKKRKTNKPNHT